MNTHEDNRDLAGKRVALVINDPQRDALDPGEAAWPFFGAQVESNRVVDKLERLLRTAQEVGLPVFVSPHYYGPQDEAWSNRGPVQRALHEARVFAVGSAERAETPVGTGAELHERLRPLLLDGQAVIVSPHKIFGPQSNDLVMQLRQRRIDTVLLAGPGANLCLEAHMRELVEQGFEVYVVKDATATISPEAYEAAQVNYEMIASGAWTTDEAIARCRNV